MGLGSFIVIYVAIKGDAESFNTLKYPFGVVILVFTVTPHA